MVGLSAAGLSAAETLRAEGYQGRLTLVGAEAHLPYDRPPLSKQVLAGQWPVERTGFRPADGYAELAAELVLGNAATGLRVAERAISLADGSELRYDGLLVATGLRPRRLPAVEGLDAAYVLRTLDDALALRAALTEPGVERVAVIGAGFLGTEIAASARGMGLDVVLIDPQPVPLGAQLGHEIGALAARLHAARGVEVLGGSGVQRVLTAGGRRVTGVLLDGGRTVPAHVIVLAVGSVPETGWLAGSDLASGEGVLCDEYCRAAPGVFAAGDVAAWIDQRQGRRTRLEHRMHAIEQGAAAARNLLAEDSGAMMAFSPVPYFWSDQYDVKLQVVGTAAADARLLLEPGAVEPGSGLDDRGSFTAVYVRDDRVVGGLCWNRPARLPALRRLVATNAPWTAADLEAA